MVTLQKEILSYISDFKDVIQICMNSTEYKKDVPIYKSDYILMEEFTKEILDSKKDIYDIIKNIMDDQTAKIITDYWRKGKYGELECNEFHKMKVKIRSAVTMNNL